MWMKVFKIFRYRQTEHFYCYFYIYKTTIANAICYMYRQILIIKTFICKTEIPPSMKIAGFLDPLPDVLIFITCHQLHYLHKAFILIWKYQDVCLSTFDDCLSKKKFLKEGSFLFTRKLFLEKLSQPKNFRIMERKPSSGFCCIFTVSFG